MSSRGASDSSSGSNNNHEDDTAAAEAALKARLSRKRTKTGCLTCRKRRIKCGEERPICRNCIKSRRHCEGYVPTYRFRQPQHEYGQAQPIHYEGSMPIPPGETYYSPSAPAPAQYGAPIAFSYYQPQTNSLNDQQPTNKPPRQMQDRYVLQNVLEHQFIQAPASLIPHQQADVPKYVNQQDPLPLPYADRSYVHSIEVPDCPDYGIAFNTSEERSPRRLWEAYLANHPAHQQQQAPLPQIQHNWHDSAPHAAQANAQRSSPASAHSGTASLDRVWDEYQHAAFVPDTGPTQLLTDAAVELQDDDYYDVDSDDELEISFTTLSQRPDSTLSNGMTVTAPYRQLVHAVHKMSLGMSGISMPQNMLDTYRPERVANPLRNEATARVFLHWITSTGPGLQAPFERDPRNTISVFANGEVPLNRRNIWTYVMPMLALHDQGLLHAMLALSSIHIAHLQGGSLTPAFQHYAWSLKRVHNAVSNKKKRLNITTIAASMLLGHYEMMTAEHSKWNTHLAGAKQLLVETDFAGMMRQFYDMKKERATRGNNSGAYADSKSMDRQQDELLDQIPSIDESLVSRFYGQEIKYGQQGFIEVGCPRSAPALDLCGFETLKDMFWWYCKQDVYLSLVGGNPLLMDWRRWSVCPPRAPLGKLDAVYGSFDHLVLILGRITTYSDKDRRRKLKVMKQQGGHWMPHPNSAMARAPPPPPPPSGTEVPPPMTVPFYGMAPPPPPARMPSTYEPAGRKSSPLHNDDDDEEEEVWSLGYALHEHDSIMAALAEFHARLGVDFAPVPQDPLNAYSTSFGPALLFKSFDVACVIAMWNLAMIIQIRSHPYYHPAAHVASAMAAAETVLYAQNIGRIAAGIPLPDATDAALDPFQSACLIEATMPSMWAATQYTDADQRYETVARIYNVARRTGWRTADIIANGCETAWVQTAMAGRGPPYTRIVESQIRASLESHASGQPYGNTADVVRSAQSRLYRASGLLDMEEDVYAGRATKAVRSH